MVTFLKRGGIAMQMGAGQFKAHCLKLMDEVQKFHREIVITKHGRPVARLVPAQVRAKRSLFGFMRGQAIIHGDLVAPIAESWDADH